MIKIPDSIWVVYFTCALISWYFILVLKVDLIVTPALLMSALSLQAMSRYLKNSRKSREQS